LTDADFDEKTASGEWFVEVKYLFVVATRFLLDLYMYSSMPLGADTASTWHPSGTTSLPRPRSTWPRSTAPSRSRS